MVAQSTFILFTLLQILHILHTMPSLGVYFTDEEAEAVERAASVSPEKKPSPYIAQAVRDRLGKEGQLPGNKDEDVAKLTAKVAAAVRKDPTVADKIEAVIGKSTRRQLATA